MDNVQTWHVELGTPEQIEGDTSGELAMRFYDTVRFDDPQKAFAYFESLPIPPGDTLFLEYSDYYTAGEMGHIKNQENKSMTYRQLLEI